jgi:NAD+ kinase
VTVDGQLHDVLDPGDWVTAYAGPRRARLVHLAELDFLGRLVHQLEALGHTVTLQPAA